MSPPTQEERLRIVENWSTRHEERCEGRHKALGIQIEEMRAAIAAGSLAAADGRRKILWWARAGVGLVGGGMMAFGGAQTVWGKLALAVLGAL